MARPEAGGADAGRRAVPDGRLPLRRPRALPHRGQPGSAPIPGRAWLSTPRAACNIKSARSGLKEFPKQVVAWGPAASGRFLAVQVLPPVRLITIAQRHASSDLRQLGMPVQYVNSLFARTGDERAGQRCAGRPDAPAARRPVAHGLAIRWLWSFRRHSPEKDLCFPCKLSKNGADISKRSRYFQTHT